MATIGRSNQLKVVKEVKFGVYLDGEELGDILLPVRYVPENTKVGDTLDVFIYLDSEDYLIATTLEPKTAVGEFACLTAVSVNRIGAFFDWGLPKDLLVPFNEQKQAIEEEKKYIVYTYLDNETDRIAGSTKLNKFLDNYPHSFKKGQQVDLLIEDHTHIGYKAIIDGTHWGVVYDNDVFKPLRYGQKMKGFIKQIRPDGKINLSLQKLGYGKTDDVSKRIMHMLEDQDGFIACNDKTPPDVIYKLFGVSKKAFKLAIGRLYKERSIIIDERGIRLITK
ncbi:CvfB family protein [Aliamphritea ceti]|uniref:CvfB family protein n=1 Tax=Aliamphritea ceti TaxID=1524258 RepID=UPI0021C2F570|nr:S1-like domain-containing RNA-binding protein [Aliamphritea ceti]